MKNVLLVVLTLVMGSLKGFAQQKVSLANTVNLSLPEAARHITKDEARSHIIQHIKNDTALLSSVIESPTQEAFVYQNVLLLVRSARLSVAPDYLTALKKQMDQTFSAVPSYTSSLTKDTHKEVLVMKHTLGGVNFYSFFAFDHQYTKIASGLLQLNPVDTTDGQLLLNQVLKDMAFVE